MKTKILKSVALVLAMLCVLCFPVAASATSHGTNGDELQVMQPETLEIQLGGSWAGVEFELKTDAGMYPGTIPVGADGVLRLEIGGSSSYILTCINSTVEVPEPGETAPAVEDESGVEATDGTEAPDLAEATGETSETDPIEVIPSEDSAGDTVAGIPVKHIAMFGGGLLAAIAALVGMNLYSKKKDRPEIDEDDEI